MSKKYNHKGKDWELSLGFYPGILSGFRTYRGEERDNHVLYIPFVDICLTVYND
tara:strand:- start:256 stop:417 length:162 start_codon:yes stop_codon:yes gene_type:complete